MQHVARVQHLLLLQIITSFHHTSLPWQPWHCYSSHGFNSQTNSFENLTGHFLKHLFCLSIVFLFMFVCVLSPLFLTPLDGMLACGASSDLQPPLDRVRSASANCLSPGIHVPSPESERYQPLPQHPSCSALSVLQFLSSRMAQHHLTLWPLHYR